MSPWLNNERRVVFSTPLKAPAFIKKIVGQKVTVCTAFTWLLSCLQPVIQHSTLQTCNQCMCSAACILHATSQVANAGVEVLEVIETQLLQRQPDGSIIVESKPLLAAPGASKFTTHAFFSMKEEVNGHKNCTVRH